MAFFLSLEKPETSARTEKSGRVVFGFCLVDLYNCYELKVKRAPNQVVRQFELDSSFLV